MKSRAERKNYLYLCVESETGVPRTSYVSTKSDSWNLYTDGVKTEPTSGFNLIDDCSFTLERYVNIFYREIKGPQI